MDMTKTNKIHNDSVCTWQTRCSVCTWQPAYTHEHVRGGTELLRRGEGYERGGGGDEEGDLGGKKDAQQIVARSLSIFAYAVFVCVFSLGCKKWLAKLLT